MSHHRVAHAAHTQVVDEETHQNDILIDDPVSEGRVATQRKETTPVQQEV